MSGNQRRLLKVQASMAGFMTVANIVLIPLWGIVGAAMAAAITNAGTNAWNLLEVRKVLGFSPFSRSYARLFFPGVAAVLVAILLKHEAGIFRHDWLAIGASIFGTYAAFAGVVAALGLDEDDRLIAGAMWGRIRQSLPNLRGMES
jgi:O-antigen/teichoic acid export membrane protein